MNNEEKIIHAHVNKPHNSFFKQQRNERASCYVVRCNNFENCDIYKRKECIMVGFARSKCPYGKSSFLTGFTKRASKYYDWISEKESQFKGVLLAINNVSEIMGRVGDYVYLPYAHITMNESLPFLSRAGFGSFGNPLLPKENFDISEIINICEFKPRALFGNEEIKSYQEVEIPKFVKHLSEQFPELYEKAKGKSQRIKEVRLTDIGREAYLFTINPNAGKIIDIHTRSWLWDGEYLTHEGKAMPFAPIKDYSEIRIKPGEDAIVKISCDEQVNENTKFYRS